MRKISPTLCGQLADKLSTRKAQNVITQTRQDLEQVHEILDQRLYELRFGEDFDQEELHTRKSLRYWRSTVSLTILKWMTRGVLVIS